MITIKISMVTIQDYFTHTDSLMYEIKTKGIYKGFSNDKKSLTLVIVQLSQNIKIIQTN